LQAFIRDDEHPRRFDDPAQGTMHKPQLRRF